MTLNGPPNHSLTEWDTVAVIVTIGLNSNETLMPLPADTAMAFAGAVRALFSTLYVDGAQSRGQWQDERTGIVVTEDSLTYVGEAESAMVTHALATLANLYEQDAIACTIGNTDLVGANNV